MRTSDFKGWDLAFECLRAKGYQSLQVTHHMEQSLTKFEVVNLLDVHVQTDGCPGEAQKSRYTQGWDGATECRCRQGKGTGWGQHGLNCDG